jgi:hypothetical protein
MIVLIVRLHNRVDLGIPNPNLTPSVGDAVRLNSRSDTIPAPAVWLNYGADGLHQPIRFDLCQTQPLRNP